MEEIGLDLFENGPCKFNILNHIDSRGSFEVLFENSTVNKKFTKFPNVNQINIISAFKDSIRGFHGTHENSNHWKIVTCINGRARDFFLDIRPQSSTFGQIASIELNSKEKSLIVVPPGFAHAMQSLLTKTDVVYATNIEYKNQNEIDIQPIDPLWANLWDGDLIISPRDLGAKSFEMHVQIGTFK